MIIFQAILKEMTQDPTTPVHSRTTALVEKPHLDKTEKLSEVPSKMVALLHKALLEQKHDEADRRQEFEQGQQDLKQQEAVTKKQAIEKSQEDPNMELARYIEEEEQKAKAQKTHAQSLKPAAAKRIGERSKPTSHTSPKPVNHPATDHNAHSVISTKESLPGDRSLDSEVGIPVAGHHSQLFRLCIDWRLMLTSADTASVYPFTDVPLSAFSDLSLL